MADPEEQAEPVREQEISLDELTAAYAESMGRRAEPDAAADAEPTDYATDESEEERQGETGETTAGIAFSAEAEDSDEDDPCELCPRTIFEAMLFVGNDQSEPLTADRAAELMRGVSPSEIPELVEELNQRYASSGCPYRIVSEEAGYRLSLERAFYPVRNKFYGRVREARLSQAALDVLAIVAYRQPIVAEDVSQLRGHPSGHVLAQLVRRRLLRIERPPGKQRPVIYHTTDRFLDLFGLESLDDLPESEELEKL